MFYQFFHTHHNASKSIWMLTRNVSKVQLMIFLTLRNASTHYTEIFHHFIAPASLVTKKQIL